MPFLPPNQQHQSTEGSDDTTLSQNTLTTTFCRYCFWCCGCFRAYVAIAITAQIRRIVTIIISIIAAEWRGGFLRRTTPCRGSCPARCHTCLTLTWTTSDTGLTCFTWSHQLNDTVSHQVALAASGFRLPMNGLYFNCCIYAYKWPIVWEIWKNQRIGEVICATKGLEASSWQTKDNVADNSWIRPPACSEYWSVHCLAMSSRPLYEEAVHEDSHAPCTWWSLNVSNLKKW